MSPTQDGETAPVVAEVRRSSASTSKILVQRTVSVVTREREGAVVTLPARRACHAAYNDFPIRLDDYARCHVEPTRKICRHFSQGAESDVQYDAGRSSRTCHHHQNNQT